MFSFLQNYLGYEPKEKTFEDYMRVRDYPNMHRLFDNTIHTMEWMIKKYNYEEFNGFNYNTKECYCFPYKDIELIKFFHIQIGSNWSKRALYLAIEFDNLELVDLFCNYGCPIGEYAMDFAINLGSIDIVKYLYSKNVTPKFVKIENIVDNGELEILKFYCENMKGKITSNLIEIAVKNMNSEMLEFLSNYKK